MNTAAIQHLDRARLEGLALRGSTEALLFAHDGMRPEWVLVQWLAGRGFAQGRAASAAGTFVRATTEAALSTTGRGPVDGALPDISVTNLRLALRQLEHAMARVGLDLDAQHDVRVRFPARDVVDVIRLQLSERELLVAGTLSRAEGPEGDDALCELIYDRAWHRVLSDQIGRVYGRDVATSLSLAFRETDRTGQLTRLDEELARAVVEQPVAGDYATSLEREFFTPLDRRGDLQLSDPVLLRIASEALAALPARVGLDIDPLVIDQLPWRRSAREDWI